MLKVSPTWPSVRQGLVIAGVFGLLWFAWASHARTLFNGLASPLFFALAAVTIFLATQFRICVTRSSLILYALFAGWILYVDARSGEFLPALAKDSHWLILPVASLLFAQAFREYPKAFEFVQIGAALCIINLLATMFVMAEWFDNWHYPPIFGHIRHLGLSVGFLTLFLFSRTASNPGAAALFRVCRIAGLAIVFWSGTRASILAWICCFAIFISIDRRWLKVLLLETVAAIFLSQLPPPPFPVNEWTPSPINRTIDAIVSPENKKSSSAATAVRLQIWKTTLKRVSDVGQLWTGLGGNGFARLQVMHGAEITAKSHVHPHNAIIQFICDWGLVGLSLIVALFFRTITLTAIRSRSARGPVALSCIAYPIVTGMFDATLFHLEHLVYLMLGLGLFFSKRPHSGNTTIHVKEGAAISLIVGLALAHYLSLDYRIGIYWYFPTQ